MRITFYGGAKSVTGANYLLDSGDIKILVDCGLYQGSKYSEDFNYEKFAYNPTEINFVFLTHSHTDHVGRLPKLFKEGFRGRVIASKPTIDLASKALPDNLKIITEEAKREGREPIFELKDLDGVLGLAEGFNYEVPIVLGGGIVATLHDAGHILGSTIVEIDFDGKKIYFTGDLGNPPTPLLQSPYFPKDADYAVVESAYGSRVHEDRSVRKLMLENIIKETIINGGTLMIPSFAMERTQELLYELNQFVNHNQIPKVPIFVDSPLAINLTEVYKKHSSYFNKNAHHVIESGDDIFNFPGLIFTRTSDESKAINNVKGPKIIIAGSGMSMGGRILHHEMRYLPDSNSAILFVGYQVQGSLGRRILDGEKEVKIFGEKIAVNCQIRAIGGYSAHADQTMLLKWIESAGSGGNLKKVFVVQGEEDSSKILAEKTKTDLKIDAVVPSQGESFAL
ncbi:MAG TPA: MBL fold metallo-hydrolase [Candidatus Paceibacterota bacterium]